MNVLYVILWVVEVMVCLLLIGVILILGGLQFFPALSLGPIVEHFQVLETVGGR